MKGKRRPLKLWEATVTFEFPIVVAAETKEEADSYMQEAAEEEYSRSGAPEVYWGRVAEVVTAADLPMWWSSVLDEPPHGDTDKTIAELLQPPPSEEED